MFLRSYMLQYNRTSHREAYIRFYNTIILGLIKQLRSIATPTRIELSSERRGIDPVARVLERTVVSVGGHHFVLSRGEFRQEQAVIANVQVHDRRELAL